MISGRPRRNNESGESLDRRGEASIPAPKVLSSGRSSECQAIALTAADYSCDSQQLNQQASFAVYNPAIQDARMTFAFFVETKFVPGHVQHKTSSGQTHYQAILKHLLRPETVNRIFNRARMVKARLKSVPDWPYLDDVRLCDITADHVRRLIASSIAHQYSPQTVKHIKNVFFAVISHAQREGCFKGFNPVGQVKLPPISRQADHNLTINQTREMLDMMRSPEKELAIVVITTGMNILEICNLRWEHVNLSDSPQCADGELIPPRSIAVRGRWNPVGLGGSNRSRKRNIEIPELLMSVLHELRSRDGNAKSDDFVLTSENGQPMSAMTVKNGRLKRIGRKLGLPWLSWRALERAHTSLLTEFRSVLNSQMWVAIQKVPPVKQSSQWFNKAATGMSKSDTIGPKFPCRSFRAGRQWRKNHSI